MKPRISLSKYEAEVLRKDKSQSRQLVPLYSQRLGSRKVNLNPWNLEYSSNKDSSHLSLGFYIETYQKSF